MPINHFSVGRDVTTTISTADGALAPTLITKFSSKQEQTSTKVKGMDGITRTLVFPDGWSGSFDLDRQDSVLDDFFATAEANYFAGKDSSTGTIMQTISEPNGTVNQYQYTGVVLKFDDAGSWSSDAPVVQKISFTAERRIKVS
jgi:hypothetical protein